VKALQGSKIIEGWPKESREAAQLVIDKYGEPDEATTAFLIWNQAEPWKRIVAAKTSFKHEFPVPHFASVHFGARLPLLPQHFTPRAESDERVVLDSDDEVALADEEGTAEERAA
jgi:hypothetical protein